MFGVVCVEMILYIYLLFMVLLCLFLFCTIVMTCMLTLKHAFQVLLLVLLFSELSDHLQIFLSTARY